MQKLILDGAMGTMLKKYGVNEIEYSNITCPHIVKKIHKEYIEAGADIITTNTFNVNGLTVKNRAYEICKKGVTIARSFKGILVAGSIGPTDYSLFFEKRYKNPKNIERLKEIYLPQISALLECDFLLFETVYDIHNLIVGLSVARKLNKNIPIIISITVDTNGKIYSGEDIYNVMALTQKYNIKYYGFNCSFGSKHLTQLIKKLDLQDIILYPNTDNELPQTFAENMTSVKDKIVIAGGCCETTPDYTVELKKVLKKY